MKRLVLAPLIFVLASPSQADVDSKVHKMCLQAKDYLGCVKAQTTKATDIPNLRVIQGQTELTGNACPRTYGYSGAGYCTIVICQDRWKVEPDLKDKFWTGCGLFKPSWGRQVVKAVVDEKCPANEPIIGTQSSCFTQDYLDQIKAEKKRLRKERMKDRINLNDL